VKKEGLGAFSHGTPILRHSLMYLRILSISTVYSNLLSIIELGYFFDEPDYLGILSNSDLHSKTPYCWMTSF
jgi:ABC-type branched-subunit amino acid transport system permease subunit